MSCTIFLIERKGVNALAQTVIGGKHHGPVVDEPLTDDAVIDLALDLLQRTLPRVVPSGIEVVTVTDVLYGDVRGVHLAELHEAVVLVGLLLGMLALVRLQKEDTGEQGDVGSGYLLPGEDNAAINIGGLPSLTVGGTLDAPGTVIDAFEEVDVLLAQGVLVLVEMDDHVAHLRTLVAHGVIGGALKIADLGISLEEID
jgi:hypothetical protein